MLKCTRVSRWFSISNLTYSFDETAVDRMRRLNEAKEETFGLPWSFKGVPEKEVNLRFLADRMLIQNKIPVTKVLSQFYEIFEKVMSTINSPDLSEIKHLLEPNLYNALTYSLQNLKAQGISLKSEVHEDFPDSSGKPTLDITDAVVYRGVNVNRENNDHLDKYHVYNDSDLGVVCFTHLDLSNPLAYVNQAHIEDLHSKNRQTLVQCLVSIKSPWKIKLYKENQEVSEYTSEYTYKQQWIFESQCLQPEWVTNENKHESYMEWMAKFKPETWIVTDMNDMLNANPLVRFKK